MNKFQGSHVEHGDYSEQYCTGEGRKGGREGGRKGGREEGKSGAPIKVATTSVLYLGVEMHDQ